MKSKNIEVSKEVAGEIWKLNGQILELKQEIHELKCCGNCKHYLTVINEGRCFEGIKDIYRYDPNAKSASGDEVCDKWQKL